ncbi:hypothetical protein ACFE04_022171 [Oxalis oulophora]
MEPGLRSGLVLICLVLVVCCVIDPVLGDNRKPKNVQVAVKAKWSGTPLLLEAGELLSKERKDIFWEFTEDWLKTEQVDDDYHTAKDCLKKISKHASSFLTEPLASLLEFSLTLRSGSPRLVLYRQLAEESLSSFPPLDDTFNNIRSEVSEKNEKSDHMLVGKNPKSPNGKCCWVDTGNALFFDVEELLLWLHKQPETSEDSLQQPELFDFDHVHPDSSFSSPAAILYGALGTDCFKKFHVTLVQAAKEGKVKYVVRPVLPSGCESKTTPCGAVGAKDPVSLSGYGVELALKNMEYKAMDDSEIKKGVTLEDPHIEDLSQDVRGFIFSKILERKPELQSEIMSFRDHLLGSTISDTLDVWQLKDLGHQTAQRIVHASDPFQSMQEINNNFPSIVSSLSRMKLNDSIKDEIIANQRMVPPGKSLMALNGASVSIDDIDLYQLLDLVHQDLSLADQFSKLKIPHSTVRKLLMTLPPSESNTFRIDFRSPHVQYLNDLEKDAMYKRWRNNLNELLMPVFPGQLRYIRKNLFHAVYILDPATICGLESIDMITSLYENSIPMRFGVVLYSSKFVKDVEISGGELHLLPDHKEDISSLIIRLFLYIKENHGSQTAFQFLSDINRLRTESEDTANEAPEMHHVEGAFVDTMLPKAKTPPQELLLKLEKDQNFKEQAQESSMSVFQLGLDKLHCSLLMNGLVVDPNEALMNAMNDELPRIQEQVYFGQINSRTDVLDKFLSESGVTRYNPQIITEGKVKPRYVSLASSAIDDVKPVTHLLTIDVTSKKWMKLLHEGIRYLLAGSESARVGVLFTASQDVDLYRLRFVNVFEFTAASYSHKKNVLKFLDQLCSFYEKNSAVESTQFTDKICELVEANGLSSKAYKSSITEFSEEKVRKHLNKVANFLYGQLGLEANVNAVITNGRVVLLSDESSFLSHDLKLLESMEFSHRIKEIGEIIEEVNWQEEIQDIDPDMLTSKFVSDTIMYASSSVAMRDRSSHGARFEILNTDYSAIVLEKENSTIHIDAVLDPLSPTGQKLASLLGVLGKFVQPSLRIVLNPLSSLVDLPLKNYYRYVLPSMDDFSSTDYTVNGPKAFFANMPLSKTLTMNLDVPETWLVEPVLAIALYVVDLVKFRQTAAGDNLRVFYETLSKDPNSLSNLDQDLPNYAQHMVPIFSLPQEWLWCESWCGNATKAKAKTIDLCNNPMTKEPKLQGARRIVTEWPELDLEARQFTAKIIGDQLESQEPVLAKSPVQPQATSHVSEDPEQKDEL